MGDVISISTLAGEFKSLKELQKYCNSQYETLQAAAKQIKQLQDEIEHLKGMLVTTTTLTSSVIVSPEQAIIDAQIVLLRERGMTRELTLEEVKRLDLLIKNKKILEEDPKTLKGESKSINTNLPAAELVRIAATPEKEESI